VKRCGDDTMSRLAIIRRTLAKTHGYGLNATCECCRHRTDLDIMALIERFGSDFRYVGRRIEEMLTCTACGERAASVQLHNCPLIDHGSLTDGPHVHSQRPAQPVPGDPRDKLLGDFGLMSGQVRLPATCEAICTFQRSASRPTVRNRMTTLYAR